MRFVRMSGGARRRKPLGPLGPDDESETFLHFAMLR
jgi:hypothetical protein